MSFHWIVEVSIPAQVGGAFTCTVKTAVAVMAAIPVSLSTQEGIVYTTPIMGVLKSKVSGKSAAVITRW
jgi:hypothetical protein